MINEKSASFCLNRGSIVDSSVEFTSEPFHGLIFADFVLSSDGSLATSTQAYSGSRSLQDYVEVHAEDTGEGVILESQIDMLLNAKSEASCMYLLVPVSEKLRLRSSLSLTLSPLSSNSSALSPRTVT